jgi:hypothetical protein
MEASMKMESVRIVNERKSQADTVSYSTETRKVDGK